MDPCKGGLVDVFVHKGQETLCPDGRGPHDGTLKRCAGRRDRAVDRFRHVHDRIGIYISGHDEIGILRRVETVIIGKGVLAAKRLDLMLPTDDRPAARIG